ncbi:MAG: hypothetical protein OEV40_17625 [Acidimicrobiia bacterium]|nr:hypothetical protein [Acidimicrobiia bacterium]
MYADLLQARMDRDGYVGGRGLFDRPTVAAPESGSPFHLRGKSSGVNTYRPKPVFDAERHMASSV